jgi:hypothetical protein
LWSHRRKAEEDRGTAWTGPPATYAWRHSPQVGRILRRLACVPMMQASDHGRLHDPALIKALHWSRLRRVLVQGEVCSGTVVVEDLVAQQATQVGVVQHHDVVETLTAEGADQTFRVRILPGD